MTQEIKEECTYAYIPKSLAKKVDELGNCASVEKEILSYIEETKLDLRISIESIDEDILLYRAHMIKARDAFKIAKNEELEGLYVLWEGFDKERCKLGNMVKQAKDTLDPLRKEIKQMAFDIQDLNSAISNLDVGRMYNFFETLERCKEFIDKEKTMTKFLFDNYKVNNNE